MTTQTKYRTADLKCQLDEHGNRINTLEQSDALQNERIGELRKDTNEHTKTIKMLEEFTITAGQAIGIGRWVMLVFGLYIIALVWQLVTGQAVLQFP